MFNPPPSPSVPYLRRATASDVAAVGAFLRGLSASSRRFRFHGAFSDFSAGMLNILCNVDGALHQAWLAWIDGKEGATVIGEARIVVSEDGEGAELAIAVADDWQGSGVADQLMQKLLGAAANAGVPDLYGDVIDSNPRMLAFMRRHSFKTERIARSELVRMRRDPRHCARVAFSL
jgi:GNAT superfamily N-acetyltransferase